MSCLSGSRSRLSAGTFPLIRLTLNVDGLVVVDKLAVNTTLLLLRLALNKPGPRL